MAKYSKSLDYYPQAFWEYIEICGLSDDKMVVAVEDQRQGVKLQGLYHAFVGALRRAGSAPSSTIPREKIIQAASLATKVQCLVRELEPGKWTVTWENRDRGWQSQALLAATRVKGAPIEKPDLGPQAAVIPEGQERQIAVAEIKDSLDLLRNAWNSGVPGMDGKFQELMVWMQQKGYAFAIDDNWNLTHFGKGREWPYEPVAGERRIRHPQPVQLDQPQISDRAAGYLGRKGE